MMSTTIRVTGATFQMRFESLFQAGRALSFPCDADGKVPLDHMPQRARDNYLFARAMIGRDFAMPCVVPAGH
jgi:hypothetical protein